MPQFPAAPVKVCLLGQDGNAVGVMLYQDGQNYLRFEIRNDGGSIDAASFAILGSNGFETLDLPGISLGSREAIQVVATGGTFTFSISNDGGTTYTPVGSFSQSLNVTQGGVYADNCCGASSGTTVATIASFTASANSGGGPTVQLLSASKIDPNPPDGIRYEKAIGYYTSPSYPSYFLATEQAAYIYDPQQGTMMTIAADGGHHERARSYYASPSDTYQSIIAAAGDGNGQLVAYINPANTNGGDPTAPWMRFVIYGNSGCHDLYVADLDGRRNSRRGVFGLVGGWEPVIFGLSKC